MDHSTKETALVIDVWDDIPYYFTGVVKYLDNYHWFVNGLLNREDEPAVEYANGAKYWYLKGVMHREDGPAVEYKSGKKEWWLNGRYYSQEEWFEQLTTKQKEKFVWNMDNW